jgi:hypothetical protein
MANIWSNSKATLDIIDESDSDKESIFSGDSSNNGSGNSKIEDEEPNRDDDTDDDTDDNLPSAGGWSKHNSQLDFVKFSFTSQSGFKPPNPAPSEKCETECQSANFVCIYTVIIKITHFHKSCVV